MSSYASSPCQSWPSREPWRHVSLVTLLEVEVGDGLVPAGVLHEMGDLQRLVSFRHRAKKPAWVGSRLKAGGEPRVPPVKGEFLRLLGTVVELHDVHWLPAEGMTGEGQGQVEGHKEAEPQSTERCKGEGPQPQQQQQQQHL